MRATGVIRQIDAFGRIVLPAELRKVMNVQTGDNLEFFTEENQIIIKKYEVCCLFCNNQDDLIEFSGKKLCPVCLEKIKNL